MLLRSVRSAFLGLAALVPLVQLAAASSDSTTQYVESTNAAGETVYLSDNRQPAIYTQNFGDCLGDSLINVTRFDAAYYKDNMTVLFHLEGSTALNNESLMSKISSTIMTCPHTKLNTSVHRSLRLWRKPLRPDL